MDPNPAVTCSTLQFTQWMGHLMHCIVALSDPNDALLRVLLLSRAGVHEAVASKGVGSFAGAGFAPLLGELPLACVFART